MRLIIWRYSTIIAGCRLKSAYFLIAIEKLKGGFARVFLQIHPEDRDVMVRLFGIFQIRTVTSRRHKNVIKTMPESGMAAGYRHKGNKS